MKNNGLSEIIHFEMVNMWKLTGVEYTESLRYEEACASWKFENIL